MGKIRRNPAARDATRTRIPEETMNKIIKTIEENSIKERVKRMPTKGNIAIDSKNVA